MSADTCVRIMARISNPQAIKRVNGLVRHRRPEEKIAASEPNRLDSSFHVSGQGF